MTPRIPPDIKLTGAYEDNAFVFVVLWPDGRQERWPYRWQATARANGWTAPNGKPATAPRTGPPEPIAVERYKEFEDLASAMRRVIPRSVMADLIAHLDPLSAFIAFLRGSYGAH